MLRFRLFGIPFEVAPMFWLFSAILGGNAAQGPHGGLLLAVWVACVFVSVIIHELGHALVARRYGAEPVVRLYALGGVMQPGRGFTRGQNFLVVLCGPLAGLGLFLAVLGAAFASRGLLPYAPGSLPGIIRNEALNDLLFINLVWTLFNLLPILPLDGGLILRILLGYNRETVARIIGAVCAVGCAVGAFYIGQKYMAFFLAVLAFQNFQGAGASLGGAGR